MNTLALDVPAMYGDHHVLEVRRILLTMPGVESVDASSAFRVVEVGYDAGRASEEAIRATLEQAGYLAPLDVATESGEPEIRRDGDGEGSIGFFRRGAFHPVLGDQVSFGQRIVRAAQGLWPCPGMDRTAQAEAVPEETR